MPVFTYLELNSATNGAIFSVDGSQRAELVLQNNPFDLTGINTGSPTSFVIQIQGSRLDGSDDDFYVIRPGKDLILPAGTTLSDYFIDILEYGSSTNQNPNVYSGGVLFEDRTNPFWTATSIVGIRASGTNYTRYRLSTTENFLAIQARRDNVIGFNRPDPYIIELAFVYAPNSVVTPRLSIATLVTSQLEGDSGFTAYTFTVTRTGLITGTSSVNWALQGVGENSAAASDFTADTPLAGTIQFAENESEKTITIQVAGDAVFEPDEEFEIVLSGASSGTEIIKASQRATITNDDVALPTVTLAVSPAAVLENGTTNLVYTFTRTGDTSSALSVNYTVGGTATLGTDYTGIAATPATKTVTFAVGASIATVTVDPTADTTVESNETVALTLATGTGYTIGTSAAVVGTITNDDLQRLVIAQTRDGSEAGGVAAVFTLSRTGPHTAPLTVDYTLSGSATAGDDFSGTKTGTVAFVAGSNTTTLVIPILDDVSSDPDEQIIVTITAPLGYTVVSGFEMADALIIDNDPLTGLALPATAGFSAASAAITPTVLDLNLGRMSLASPNGPSSGLRGIKSLNLSPAPDDPSSPMMSLAWQSHLNNQVDTCMMSASLSSIGRHHSASEFSFCHL
jgi:hypothetical protein